jgi:hypothetical protein
MVLTPYLKLHIAGTVRRGGQNIEHRMSNVEGWNRSRCAAWRIILFKIDRFPSFDIGPGRKALKWDRGKIYKMRSIK